MPTACGQAEAGRLDAEGVGVDRRDQRAAVGVSAGGAGVLHLRDRADAADHAGRRLGQLGGLAEEGLAVGDGQQVGAQAVDLGQKAGLRGGGDAEHGDDGGDADGDAQGREAGPQLAGAQADARPPGRGRRGAAAGARASR